MIISRQYFFSFLYILCLAVLLLNNYELTFLVWSVVALISLRTNFSKNFIYIICCYLAILLISFFTELFFYDHSIFNKIRDITYLLKPILGLLIGYNFAKKYAGNALNYIVNCGIFFSVIHLVIILYSILAYKTLSVSEIRHYAGYFNDFEPYVFVLILFASKFNITISKKKRFLYLGIVATSIFCYLSRTNFIQLLILILAVKGFFNLNIRSIKVISFTILLTLVSYALIYNSNPKRKGTFSEEFLYKVKIIPIEAFKTKINQEDWKDFNDNYRSYENIRTAQQLSHNETWWFGEGIGSQVDLKQKVYLGDMELRQISILHNGFMTVLLKTGIIGLCIYLVTLFFFLYNPRANTKELYTLKLLFIGTGVFLVLSNWVFMGVYNLLDSKSLLIGFLFAYKNHLVQQKL